MKKLVIVRLLLVITIISFASVTIAQQDQVFQYAVKVVCGKSDGSVVAPGTYLTAINVHNPTETAIGFRKKIAIALPGEKPGPVTKFFEGRLGPNQALEIDCKDIFRLIEFRGDFLKGFVVIECKVDLDVVAVYTATGATGQVETLHIEHISPRCLKACPDLVVESIDKGLLGFPRLTVIRATIKNIGNAAAGSTLTEVIDPNRILPNGAPYNFISTTPPLEPGAVTTVIFYLPDWVLSDVTLKVTADYNNDLSECDEDNNVKVF